jgi:hypothetical protein
LTEKKTEQAHSRTKVHQHLHGKRTTMTVRILHEIKDKFTSRTRQLGLNTCHVAEGLFTGWLYGVEEKVELVHQSPIIDLTLVRNVKRVRRYFTEVVEEKEQVTQKCTFKDCKSPAIAEAFYKNKNEHHFVCNQHLESVVKPNPKVWQVSENVIGG